MGLLGPVQPPAAAAADDSGPAARNTPNLTVPQILAFAAFAVFVGLAFLADPKPDATVSPAEFGEVRKLTLFLIAALLPSDALIRYGRSILFRSVRKAQQAAADAPPTTIAQVLAFAAFLVVVLTTLFSDTVISGEEFNQVNDVLRVLILALLPSDAAVRFGRALYLRGSTEITAGQARKI